MAKTEFQSSLDTNKKEALLEAASNYINPDMDTLQKIFCTTSDALAKIEVPVYENEETAAYSFQALFEARLIEEWLKWLDSELKAKTNNDVSLTSCTPEEERAAIGGAIMGANAACIITRNSDGLTKLLVVGPYKEPIELYATK